jgi:HK97 family phage major capsid protein
MNREQMLARMQALLDTADAEARGMTADEQSEFDQLKARVAGLDATQETRRNLAALRQQSGIPEHVERNALAPSQSVSSLFQRQAGDTRRVGDMIRAQLGIGAAQNVGTGSAGGFTVPESVAAEVIDLARAKARVIAAGARTVVVTGPQNRFATVENDPTISNHAENDAIDETEIVFGSRLFQPKTAVALIRASVELIEDSVGFNTLVDSVLASAFAVEIDRRALYGSGSGEQLGVMNTGGVHVIDGATFATWGPLSRAYQAVRAANYEPGAFITSPGVMGAIDGLVEGGGSGQPLRRPPSLESAAFLDTTSIPADPTSAAVTGQWDNLFIAMRTPITIEATRTGGDAFGKLSVLIRAYARLDSFAVRPQAFARVTGIPVPVIA